MQYRTRKRNTSKKIIVGSLLVLFLVYIVGFTPFISKLTSGIHVVAGSLWRAEETSKNSGAILFGLFGSKAELLEENKKLKEELERMSIDLLDHALLMERYEEIKEIVGRAEDSPRTVVAILARPNKTPYDTLIIDAGENARLTPGDLAMVGPVVVGEVETVYARTAKVLMYSTGDVERDGLLGDEGTPVTVIGRGSGNYYIRVARDIEVSIGDPVLFPHIDPILFGSVEYIHQLPNDPFKQLLFTSPANIYSIDTLEIVPYSTVTIEEEYE